jgi:carboxypeptidase family protein/TonB-dependent receptor-like protein
MRTKRFVLLAALMLAVPTAGLAQIGQTAVLTGIVTDTSGGVLPGVAVSVSGPALIGGARSTTTDESGVYRFPALPPGEYILVMELQGFKKFQRENVKLLLGQTITVNSQLEVGGMAENVTVTGESPTVDVKSSAAQKNLTPEVMQFVPFSTRFGPGAMLLAPGVNPNSYNAYGSGGSSSNSYMIDGVDVSDPEGGTIWVFANHNWIQEVQVIGLGANAEYGGFTGVASNSLFRSGSNRFSGLIESLYQNDKLTDSNTTKAILDANPALTAPSVDYITDTTVQVGGPFKRDKAWFFTSFQYYRPATAPAGFPQPGNTDKGPQERLEKSPRFLFKPTLQIAQNDKLTGFVEYDQYTVDARRAGATVAPIATLHQDSPEWSWNGNYTKVLSSASVLDVKYSGFWGYYYLTPYEGLSTPGWYDVDEDFYSVNSYYYYKADRVRHQANASLTHYASGFAGEHNFKFGAEFERSYVKSELGYPGGRYILASYGVPYGAVYWDGYLKDDVNNRFSAFAQDAWAVGRKLTINPGLRWDRYNGFNKHLDRSVFTTNAIAPRIGAAFDITGDGKNVIRGHYGLYFDGAKSTYYDKLDPQIAPYYFAYIDPVTLNPIEEPYITAPGTNRRLDADIKHPRMQQALVGFERELWPGTAVGANFIYRKNTNFIDDVLTNPLSDFTQVRVPDPGPDNRAGTGDESSVVLTTYRQISDALENQYLITNPDGAFRRYRGLELTLKKRMSNNFMIDGSWVISKIVGNINNTGNFGNGADYDDPNQDPRLQPFREGHLQRDNTHLAKVLALYHAPFDVLLSTAFFYTTGDTFTRTVRVALPQGRKDLFVEPRGSQRYESQPKLDIKAEKQFKVSQEGRLGVSLEGFNILNNGAITSRTTRSGGTYFTPQGLVTARQWRLGFVYRF